MGRTFFSVRRISGNVCGRAFLPLCQIICFIGRGIGFLYFDCGVKESRESSGRLCLIRVYGGGCRVPNSERFPSLIFCTVCVCVRGRDREERERRVDREKEKTVEQRERKEERKGGNREGNR